MLDLKLGDHFTKFDARYGRSQPYRVISLDGAFVTLLSLRTQNAVGARLTDLLTGGEDGWERAEPKFDDEKAEAPAPKLVSLVSHGNGLYGLGSDGLIYQYGPMGWYVAEALTFPTPPYENEES